MNPQFDNRPEPSIRQTLRLLYVEDNPRDADLSLVYFAEHAPEFEIEIVDTGQKCLERLQEGMFDLLLLDYCLPDMDGLEVLATIIQSGMRIPTVMVTDDSDEDLVVKALRLGASNCVPKCGHYWETLPGLLHSTLEEHRQQQSLALNVTEQLRILYVEHEPMDIEQTLSHFAEAAPNLVVEVVQTSAAALEHLIQLQPYDLLLIELRMPDQSGLEFVRKAKDCGLRLPPFIIVSSQGNNAVAIAAIKLGAADYIRKREGYLEQLPIRINDTIAHDRQNRHLNQQLLTELSARKEVEENLRQHQIELEMQNLELQQSQKALEILRKRYFDLYDQAPVGYCSVSKKGLIMEANANAARLLGVAPGALIKKTFTSFILKEDADNYYLLCQQLFQTGKPKSIDLRMVKHDGTQIWAHLVIKVMPDEDDNKSLLLVALSDVTGRKQAEERLQLVASVFTYAQEGIMITTAEVVIIDLNEAFCLITGYSRDEVIGQNPSILKSDRQGNEFYAEMWRELTGKGYWSGEIWNRRKNGKVYPEQLTISAVPDVQGRTQRYVGLFSDISSLKEQQFHLEHLAQHDALTNLPNRVLLSDRLRQGMVQASRRKELLAVVYLDLDGFKTINDNHGHDVGDELLKGLATRMKRGLREGDTLTRLGGDEFVAVLVGLVDVAASIPLLNRLLAAAAQPLLVANLTLRVSASLGVTFYPQAEDIDADQLLRQADQSMYQAKLAGRNRYHIFDAVQDRSNRNHLQDIALMRHALARREFVLYYQPKVNVRTGAIIGVEALIRWQHPEKGLLSPAEFLPVIESHPLAIEFGEWVIDGALTQMEYWQAAGLDIPVSVNVNAYHLQQPDFVERLRGLLAAHPKIRPSDLEIEVLETNALDDFGAGHSSLQYLKRLTVNQLKIDQSFVRGVLENPSDMSILEGIVGLAMAFHCQIIAEGVETVEQGEIMLELGCELAQGYGIAYPMPAADISGWAASWRPDPSWYEHPSFSRDNFPLLFANAEHRVWIAVITRYLSGGRDAPPPNNRQCRLGSWLDLNGKIRHGRLPALSEVVKAHSQLHVRVDELLKLYDEGRNPEVLAGLSELHALRDTLLERLNALLLEIRLPSEMERHSFVRRKG